MKHKVPTKLSKNVSKLHKRVLELLTSEKSIFNEFIIRQECRVSEINPNFKSNKERFDIVILSPIKAVIEVMGIQHEKASQFGGISLEEAQINLIKQKERDLLKKDAAIEAGWAYIIVSYKEPKVTLDELTERIIDSVSLISDNIIIEDLRPKNKLKGKGFSNQYIKIKTKEFPKVDKKLETKEFPKIEYKFENKKLLKQESNIPTREFPKVNNKLQTKKFPKIESKLQSRGFQKQRESENDK